MPRPGGRTATTYRPAGRTGRGHRLAGVSRAARRRTTSSMTLVKSLPLSAASHPATSRPPFPCTTRSGKPLGSGEPLVSSLIQRSCGMTAAGRHRVPPPQVTSL